MARRRDTRGLTAASDVLADGLARVGGPLGKIAACWHDVAGARLAKVSTPSALRRGTLTVRCSSAAWAQAISMQELELVERLERRIGAGIVTRVVGRAGGPAPRLEPAPPAPLEPVDPATEQRLEALVAHIDDPDLRRRLLAAAVATARRRAASPDPAS